MEPAALAGLDQISLVPLNCLASHRPVTLSQSTEPNRLVFDDSAQLAFTSARPPALRAAHAMPCQTRPLSRRELDGATRRAGAVGAFPSSSGKKSEGIAARSLHPNAADRPPRGNGPPGLPRHGLPVAPQRRPMLTIIVGRHQRTSRRRRHGGCAVVVVVVVVVWSFRARERGAADGIHGAESLRAVGKGRWRIGERRGKCSVRCSAAPLRRGVRGLAEGRLERPRADLGVTLSLAVCRATTLAPVSSGDGLDCHRSLVTVVPLTSARPPRAGRERRAGSPARDGGTRPWKVKKRREPGHPALGSLLLHPTWRRISSSVKCADRR